jgi:hypothetical protein
MSNFQKTLRFERLVARAFNGEHVETQELCVGSTCVSEDECKAQLAAPAAAGAPIGESAAPAALPAQGEQGGQPAPEANQDTGVATTTTPTNDIQPSAGDPVEEPTAANDNQPGADDATSDVPRELAAPQEPEAEAPSEPVVETTGEPANDKG